MPTFDGENLLVTMDSGVTNIDWQDYYEAWKDWQLAAPLNMGYPSAFRTTGGDPLNTLLDQGRYFFFRNDYGWRMKPAEEDTTIYASGNLVPEDSTLDIFTETTGAFTVGVLGLQPVTQGISQDLTDGLQAITYIGKEGAGIYIDPSNSTGFAIDSDVFPAGNLKSPCITETNLEAIEAVLPLFNIYALSSVTLTQDYSHGHTIFGKNPQNVVVTCDAGSDVTSCKFQDCTVTGELNATNIIWECIVGDLTNVNGFIYKSTIGGTLTISENTTIEECFISPYAVGQTFTIDFNSLAKTVILSDWSAGRIVVKNMVTGSFIGLAGAGGILEPDTSNTGGIVAVGGSSIFNEENAGLFDTVNRANVANQVWLTEIGNSIKIATLNKRKHDIAANTVTLYEDDKVTPHLVFDATDTLDEITPQ